MNVSGKQPSCDLSCDLMIIGTGMAGMAAAFFAARQGLDTIQVGLTGEIGFASGLIDLLGIHPVAQGTPVDDPWEGIARLCRDEPYHPYARLDIETIRTAVQTLLTFFETGGYPHAVPERGNQRVVTPVGTLKTTYAVPHTMQAGAWALDRQAPCLLVDFDGLKGYSARQIAAGLADRWPALKPVRLVFPGGRGELYVEHMARALDAPAVRQQLVDVIRPHLGGMAAVGLPAVLGMYRTREVQAELQSNLGVPVFEIPTMVPGVTGLRLRELFEQRLPAMGVRPLFQHRVLAVRRSKDGGMAFTIAPEDAPCRIQARAAVLCTGRFFGKGLQADRGGIRETLFGLPVAQPRDRASWHHKDLLDPQGHPINRAGLEVDADFRPVDAQGLPVHDNLFAAGSILAHQDWIRQKCGSGLAIATAYGAVRAAARFLQKLY